MVRKVSGKFLPAGLVPTLTSTQTAINSTQQLVIVRKLGQASISQVPQPPPTRGVTRVYSHRRQASKRDHERIDYVPFQPFKKIFGIL